jgi:hypothetical protein
MLHSSEMEDAWNTYDYEITTPDGVVVLRMLAKRPPPASRLSVEDVTARVETMRAGAISRLLRLAKGRAQTEDIRALYQAFVWADTTSSSTTTTVWHEIWHYLRPFSPIRDVVLEALEAARRDLRHRRETRLPAPRTLSLRLAVAEVGSVIMRHGPPRALTDATLPGRGERLPMIA